MSHYNHEAGLYNIRQILLRILYLSSIFTFRSLFDQLFSNGCDSQRRHRRGMSSLRSPGASQANSVF